MEYLQNALHHLKTVLKGVPFKLREPPAPEISEISEISELHPKPEKPLRQLLVLRHAKSAWGTGAKRDFDRPLATRGKYDSPRMGQWLHSEGLFPDHVVSSPAKRTKQSTQLVCEKLGFQLENVNWEPKLYNAGLVEVLEVLAGCPQTANRVMLVGHHTGLEPLLKFLYGPSLEIPGDVKLFPTAAVAHMEIPVEWDRLYTGVAQCLNIMRPRSLPFDPAIGERRSNKDRRKANRKTDSRAAA